MKKRSSEERSVSFLREAERGVAVKDLCRRHGRPELKAPESARSRLTWSDNGLPLTTADSFTLHRLRRLACAETR